MPSTAPAAAATSRMQTAIVTRTTQGCTREANTCAQALPEQDRDQAGAAFTSGAARSKVTVARMRARTST